MPLRDAIRVLIDHITIIGEIRCCTTLYNCLYLLFCQSYVFNMCRISVTVYEAVLADADADAASAGLNRSEMVELALRNEHLRRALRAEVNTSL